MAKNFDVVSVTTHAVERYIERHAPALLFAEAEEALKHAWTRAVGLRERAIGHGGGDQAYLPDLDVVVVTKRDPALCIITVLPAPTGIADDEGHDDDETQPFPALVEQQQRLEEARKERAAADRANRAKPPQPAPVDKNVEPFPTIAKARAEADVAAKTRAAEIAKGKKANVNPPSRVHDAEPGYIHVDVYARALAHSVKTLKEGLDARDRSLDAHIVKAERDRDDMLVMRHLLFQAEIALQPLPKSDALVAAIRKATPLGVPRDGWRWSEPKGNARGVMERRLFVSDAHELAAAIVGHDGSWRTLDVLGDDGLSGAESTVVEAQIAAMKSVAWQATRDRARWHHVPVFAPTEGAK